jgi:hypothetical protein
VVGGTCSWYSGVPSYLNTRISLSTRRDGNVTAVRRKREHGEKLLCMAHGESDSPSFTFVACRQWERTRSARPWQTHPSEINNRHSCVSVINNRHSCVSVINNRHSCVSMCARDQEPASAHPIHVLECLILYLCVCVCVRVRVRVCILCAALLACLGFGT